MMTTCGVFLYKYILKKLVNTQFLFEQVKSSQRMPHLFI